MFRTAFRAPAVSGALAAIAAFTIVQTVATAPAESAVPLALVTSIGLAADPAQDLSAYQAGDQVEVSPACSTSYYPATVVAVGPSAYGNGKRVTFKYPSGQQFSSDGGNNAICVRPAPGARAGAGHRPANAVPAITVPADRNWLAFKAGSHIEVSPACSDSYTPATVIKVEASEFGSYYRRYTVKYDNSIQEFGVTAPGIHVPCVRAAGGIAKQRAALPPPSLGTYNCNYRGLVAPAFDFALLDASNYRDYDGNTGTYRFDAALKRVVFLSGPKQGYSAQQVSAKTFQILDRDGSTTGNYCPFSNHSPSGKRL